MRTHHTNRVMDEQVLRVRALKGCVGRLGLLVADGLETPSQRKLLAEGHLERRAHGPGYSRLVLTASGQRALDRAEAAAP